MTGAEPAGAPVIARPAPSGRAALIQVKAVPGARRDEVAGRLGPRLKVRISAAPERGRANKAICELLARELGVRERDVSIESGATSAEKTVRVEGASAEMINDRWP